MNVSATMAPGTGNRRSRFFGGGSQAVDSILKSFIDPIVAGETCLVVDIILCLDSRDHKE